ncbi:MAG: hypothetical protein SPK09_07920, partial [Porphyromonas sp.]|nr:hypothetical protein [Porphyromonas sp.]
MQPSKKSYQSSKWDGELKEWATKSVAERLEYLSKFWQCPINEDGTITLVAQYEKSEKLDKKGNPYGFFKNIRDQEGDLLKYPYALGTPSVWAKANNKWQGNYWLIKVKLNPESNSQNPFALVLANEVLGAPSNAIQEHIQKENFIRKIYDKRGATEDDAEIIVNALKTITGDLYTTKDRFIFELLQNADDAPNDSDYVDTEIHLLSEHMLFLHNGRPFSPTDVESITSIGDSTKKKNSTTTGYKGIGFKALFSKVDSVIIRSGGFSFAFDKHSYQGKNLSVIPWQLKPIWRERYRYPKEVRKHEQFISSPVALALSLTAPTLSKENLEAKVQEYQKSIRTLFSEPRFLLFLRHVNSVRVSGLQGGSLHVKKSFDGTERDVLKLEIDGQLCSQWKVYSVEFDIPEETREAMRGSKETPEKMKEMSRSKLSFAAKIGSEGSLQAVTPSESLLFAYLPISVSPYYLPFLVNADFLTTANREGIHTQNPWNIYLFEQIGYRVFGWIARLAQGGHRDEIVSLVPERYREKEALMEAFNKGCERALSEIAFLPTASGDLLKASECFIDQTAWGEVLGDWFFDLLPKYQGKRRLSSGLKDADKLIARIELQSFEAKDLYVLFKTREFYHRLEAEALFAAFESSDIGIQDFVNSADLSQLNDWLGSQTDTIREQFATLLEASSLRQDTLNRLKSLRLWRFGDEICDAVVAHQDYKKVWRTPQVVKIVDILEVLGFVVSNECYDTKYSKIYSKLPQQSYKGLYDRLKADHIAALQSFDFSQRKSLLLTLIDQKAKWEGVGEASVADLPIFRNQNAEFRPFKLLISPKVSTAPWLSEFVLGEEEYFGELDSLLIPEKEVYTRIVLPKWETLSTAFNEMSERQPENLYADVAYFYGLSPDAKPLSSNNHLALYPDRENELCPRSLVFYHKEVESLSSQKYQNLDLALGVFGLCLPHRGILSYLSDESSPFKLSPTEESSLRLQGACELSSGSFEALLDLFVGALRWRFFEKWGVAVERDGALALFERSSSKQQYWSKDKALQSFVQRELSESLYLLPRAVEKYKEEGGILKADDLHRKILELICVEDHRESLIDIVEYSARKAFLQEMGIIELSLSDDIDDFTRKVVRLAIDEKYVLREQIAINNDGKVLKLSDLPKTLVDKFCVDGECFSVSKLIPDADQEACIARELLDKFVQVGLGYDELLRVFGFEETENTDEAIQRVIESCSPEGFSCPVAADREQLLFLVHLEQHAKLSQGFACYTQAQEAYSELFYTERLSFIDETYILSSAYGELPLPIESKSVAIYEKPFINEKDEFYLGTSLRESLDDEAKTELLSYLLSLYQEDPQKFSRVDWDKLDGRSTRELLGFTPSEAVWAEECYVLEEEQIPEDIMAWANDVHKRELFFAMGVLSEASPLVMSRKFLAGDCKEAPESIDLSDKVRCGHTLRWLQERELILKTKEQYKLLQDIAKVADKELEKSWLIDEIAEDAEEWDDKYYLKHRDEALSCRIYLYKGRMPRGVFLSGEDYLYYRYPSDSKGFKEGDEIYIRALSEDDIQGELYKHLSPKELGLIYGSRFGEAMEENKSLKQEKETLEQENAALKQELEVLKSRYSLESQSPRVIRSSTTYKEVGIEPKGTLNMGPSSNSDLSQSEKEAAQREAQKALMEEFPEWTFPEGYGTGSHRSVA